VYTWYYEPVIVEQRQLRFLKLSLLEQLEAEEEEELETEENEEGVKVWCMVYGVWRKEPR
jgi:hypothetical protein